MGFMFKLKAAAKINWSLYVLNKRDDGYHNILSLMHCIGLYDTLTFDYSDRLELRTNMDLPTEQNLVFKAADMLQRHTGIKAGAKITLKKDIPPGAGLGGGSSDAVCALIGLNKLWGIGLSKDEIKTLGSKIGSDMPFFLECPLAIVEGRGEFLTPLRIDIPYFLLVVKPKVSVSTAWAYGEIGERGKGRKPDIELTKNANNIKLVYEALKSGDTSFLDDIIYNDFEHIVAKKHPVVASLKEDLLRAGATSAIMSGSGSSVFGLFESKERAVKASMHFETCWHRVVETLTTKKA